MSTDSGDGEDEYLSAEIVDLSEGGLGLLSTTPIQPLSPLFLMFYAPGIASPENLIKCEGYATRSVAENGKYRVGVKITSLAPDSRPVLARYLANLETVGDPSEPS